MRRWRGEAAGSTARAGPASGSYEVDEDAATVYVINVAVTM
jgi:hypothetical protein